MKSVYVICAFLAVIVTSLLSTATCSALTNEKIPVSESSIVSSATVTSDTSNATNETTTAVPTTTKTTPKSNTSTSSTSALGSVDPALSTKPDVTTAIPQTDTSSTNTNTTTNATTISTSTTTTTTTPISLPPITSPDTTTSLVASVTTALPEPVLPSKERHFDGLSFFGGIILATCLMAVAAFSWKFYRQCTERNYRTL